MSATESQRAETRTSDKKRFKIQRSRLPLHCPLPEMSLWNQHPRVYLPIEDSGQEKCPYCGAEFILEP